MNPFKALKEFMIAYYYDKNETQKFYNGCLLLLMWMVIIAGIVAYFLVHWK